MVYTTNVRGIQWIFMDVVMDFIWISWDDVHEF